MEDGQSIAVIRDDGARLMPMELSRGTVEQLYLCIRLGLAAEFGRNAISLPIILDDVLVNFDPQRAGALLVALGEFSKSQQVLMFTCHPWVRALAETQVETINLMEMGVVKSAELSSEPRLEA